MILVVLNKIRFKVSKFIVPILFLILGLLLGNTIFIRNSKQNSDIIVSGTPTSSDTFILKDFSSTYFIDVNNDKIPDRLIYNFKNCENTQTEHVVKAENEVPSILKGTCEPYYWTITVRDGNDYSIIAETDKIMDWGANATRLSVEYFGTTNPYIVADYISPGAHASCMEIFKIEDKKLTPLCTKGTLTSSTACYFWSDAGSPYLGDLDGDNIPEVIEELHTYSPNSGNEIVLNGVSVFKNGALYQTEGAEYEKYLNLYKKTTKFKLVISKYDYAKDHPTSTPQN